MSIEIKGRLCGQCHARGYLRQQAYRAHATCGHHGDNIPLVSLADIVAEVAPILSECAGYLENNVAFKTEYGESLMERARIAADHLEALPKDAGE